MDKKDKKGNNSWMPIGMCLGISIGTAIGAATHNMGLWMPMGVSLGLCWGLLFSRRDDGGEEK